MGTELNKTIKGITKAELFQALADAVENMNNVVGCSALVDFVTLNDGRKAQVTIEVTTDRHLFLK